MGGGGVEKERSCSRRGRELTRRREIQERRCTLYDVVFQTTRSQGFYGPTRVVLDWVGTTHAELRILGGQASMLGSSMHHLKRGNGAQGGMIGCAKRL